MHPTGTMGGSAPALQAFATPMVSTNGLLVSPSRDSMPPRSTQVHSSNRQQTVIPPPSPAPNFFAAHGNVFSRGGRNNFGSNFGSSSFPANNTQQLGHNPFPEPTLFGNPPNSFGAVNARQPSFGQHPAGLSTTHTNFHNLRLAHLISLEFQTVTRTTIGTCSKRRFQAVQQFP